MEFVEIHPDVQALKDHRRAARCIEVSGQSDEENFPISGVLLSSDRYAEISAKYSREYRSRIETTWSFTNLVDKISRSGHPAGALLEGLLHEYGMESHLAHADSIGVGMPAERDERDFLRWRLIQMSHSGKLLANTLHLALFRLHAAYVFCGLDRAPVFDWYKAASVLFNEVGEAHKLWAKVEYSSPYSE